MTITKPINEYAEIMLYLLSSACKVIFAYRLMLHLRKAGAKQCIHVERPEESRVITAIIFAKNPPKMSETLNGSLETSLSLAEEGGKREGSG